MKEIPIIMDQWNVGGFLFVAHKCDPDRLNSPLSGKLQESQVLVNGQIYQIAASTMGKGLVLKSLDLRRFRRNVGWDTWVIDCSERVCTNILCGFTLFKDLKYNGWFFFGKHNLTTWQPEKKKSPSRPFLFFGEFPAVGRWCSAFVPGGCDREDPIF